MDTIGIMQYQQLGTGFWSIITEDNEQLRPINCPEALKKEGLKCSIQYIKAAAQMSIFMWGTAIEIENYILLDVNNK